MRLVYCAAMLRKSDPSREKRHSAGPHRSERAREAIIEAAIRIAEDVGYADASIERIARHAGAGKQTIYRWYGSKAALYIDAYTHLVPVVDSEIPSGNAETDLTNRLTTLFDTYRETVAGRILAGLVGASADDPDTAQQIHTGLIIGRNDVLRVPLEKAVFSGNLSPRFCIDTAIEMIIALVWHRLLVAPNSLDGASAGIIARRALACGEIR